MSAHPAKITCCEFLQAGTLKTADANHPATYAGNGLPIVMVSAVSGLSCSCGSPGSDDSPSK
ncbi:MAG: hypothetical protein GXP29_09170 [Planctomycetes bacterium]|nr:hypothetical protein [Planctomycetota bacterium]